MASPDVRQHLESLVGQTIPTLRGRQNIVLAVGDDSVYVGTVRSHQGRPVAIADVQSTVDRVWGGEEVPISPEAVGYRSAFIGAVLRTMEGVEVVHDPLRVRLVRARTRSPAWEYDELILALDLYLRRGQPSVTDPEVIALSELLNRLPIHRDRPDSRFRNPNAVHMKLANFMGCDPAYPGRGLAAGGGGVHAIWDRFAADREGLAVAVGKIRAVAEQGSGWSTSEAEDEGEAIEGRIVFRAHRARERDRTLVKRKKAAGLRKNGCLRREACDFDFASTYGPLGEGFIECHHNDPLAEGSIRSTALKDLALVCPNCHRMLHRSARPITVEQLRQLVFSRQR